MGTDRYLEPRCDVRQCLWVSAVLGFLEALKQNFWQELISQSKSASEHSRQTSKFTHSILPVIFNISKESIVLIACTVSWLWFRASYAKTKQALQWWQGKQSMRLFTEAEKIRDGLLQDSFAIHRSLERALEDHVNLSTKSCEDWLNKIEEFYHSLEQLSDYLSPAYIEDSLPLAIKSVVDPWQTDSSRIKIEIDLPANWKHEPPNRSLIILRILDELLQITLTELLTEILIKISLKAKEDIGELIIHISYPDIHSLSSRNNLKELEYLRQTFRLLTSGQCCRWTQGLTVVWNFRWVMRVDRFKC